MASMFVRLRVADYARWKPVFDELEPTRKGYAITGHSVHRDPEDANVVAIAFRAADLERAKQFTDSEDLRSAMQRAGVQGPPEIWFGDDVEDKRYP